MYPAVHAHRTPHKPAVIMGSGEVVTYRQLTDRSNQCAQLFASRGLVKNDAIALFMYNCPEYFYTAWGAKRSGLYYMPISTHLSATETAYPKGIGNASSERAIGDPGPLNQGIMSSFGTSAQKVYLSPAPVHHAAPKGHGGTKISSAEWLSHRESVGRPVYGSVHILNEQGQELSVGEIGTVYFAGGSTFEYHKSEEKTLETRVGSLSTVGDVGYLDADGFLYLTDRKAHMIISGGVDVYPQETENMLVSRSAVAHQVPEECRFSSPAAAL